MQKLTDEIENLLVTRFLFWDHREKRKAAVILSQAAKTLQSTRPLGDEFFREILQKLEKLPTNPAMRN